MSKSNFPSQLSDDIKNREFNDWWFNKGGEQESYDEFGDKITKEDIARQPSMPCETNAITEAIWEKALEKFKREKGIK